MGFPYSARIISCQSSTAPNPILLTYGEKKSYIPLKICRFAVRDIIMKKSAFLEKAVELHHVNF